MPRARKNQTPAGAPETQVAPPQLPPEIVDAAKTLLEATAPVQPATEKPPENKTPAPGKPTRSKQVMKSTVLLVHGGYQYGATAGNNSFNVPLSHLRERPKATDKFYVDGQEFEISKVVANKDGE